MIASNTGRLKPEVRDAMEAISPATEIEGAYESGTGVQVDLPDGRFLIIDLDMNEAVGRFVVFVTDDDGNELTLKADLDAAEALSVFANAAVNLRP